MESNAIGVEMGVAWGCMVGRVPVDIELEPIREKEANKLKMGDGAWKLGAESKKPGF
ncbi:MAG: hypothetical protein WCO97_00545 [bacterium]|nr:hypothetical protein [Verrucomicrobiota bacterium]